MSTVSFVFSTWLRNLVEHIVASGIDLTLVCSPGPELDGMARALRVRCHPLEIRRRPSPGRDAVAVLKLTQFFRRERFDIVHSYTPKAGLVTALAAAASSTPVRLHTYAGHVWMELEGPMRWLTRECDRLVGALSTRTYATCRSQRDFLIAERLVSARKIAVLGAGSPSGVNLERFNAVRRHVMRDDMRRQLGISPTAPVVVFVGRVNMDKGVGELLDAFRRLRVRFPDLTLVVVGPMESGSAGLPAAALEELSNGAGIHAVGFAAQPERYLHAADIFCLPSYREGFPSVVLEAGAMGLPTVATRIMGMVDAVVDGETGLLVPAKDPAALAEALGQVIASPELQRRLGQAAQERVRNTFDAALVNQATIDDYIRCLSGDTRQTADATI